MLRLLPLGVTAGFSREVYENRALLSLGIPYQNPAHNSFPPLTTLRSTSAMAHHIPSSSYKYVQYILTYLLTYLLHGAGSFLRS